MRGNALKDAFARGNFDDVTERLSFPPLRCGRSTTADLRGLPNEGQELADEDERDKSVDGVGGDSILVGNLGERFDP
jgi:hypothetical protein